MDSRGTFGFIARVPRTALALVFFACLLALLPAAEKPAPPFQHERLNVANSCLVESIYFYDQFCERFGDGAWVRVLQWGAKEDDEVVAGHAVAVFELKGRLWAWDINYGFLPLDLPPAHREEIEKVSPLILVKYPRITARFPLYRFDFPQRAGANAPAAMLLNENSSFRDASVVAEKLARCRPVNLVQYSYVKDGRVVTAAAAAFLFHGRLCVYFPEAGTVPFLTRQKTVDNLRQLQECLRRVHAGAFGLKPL
jgi:hypothetical protein